MTSSCLMVVRGLHFGASLLIFGLWFFDLFVAGTVKKAPGIIQAYHRMLYRAMASLWPLALVSGGVWFILVAMEMSGLDLMETFQGDTIRTVLFQTNFGRTWSMHLFWGLCGGVTTFLLLWQGRKSELNPRHARHTVVFQQALNLLFHGLFLASIAWTGHGLVGSPTAAPWHLLADAIHLLIAGIWPAGLFPLLFLLVLTRHDAALHRDRSRTVRQFSCLSLVSVGLLTATGFVNSWVLVGSWTHLFHAPYGQLLCCKLLCFGGAIAFGAHNLLGLKPQLEHRTRAEQEVAYRALARNVCLELVLATAIIVVVAILGMTAPPSK